MKTTSKVLLWLVAWQLLGQSTALAQQPYTYTSVIDSTGALKEFDFLFPSINNKGAVVFHAKFPAGGGQPAGEGIYVTEGSGYRGIAVSGSVYRSFYANPAINDNGVVAFEADLSDGSEGIFVGDGKTTGNKTVATSASGRLYQFSLVIRFSDYGLGIDGSGTAAFRAQIQGSGATGLFAGNGSKQETQLFATTSGSALQDVSPATNAAGDVAFCVARAGGVVEIRRTTVAGGAMVTIATTEGASPFSSFDNGSISINNSGRVGFVARLKAGGYGVYTSNGQGAPTSIIDTKTHPQFNRFKSASINNTGGIAFAGFLAGGGSNLFVADPAGTRQVLQSNMFGSTISAFYADLTPRSLNDSGQVVFYYGLANGQKGIAVATPSNGVQPKTLGNISTRLPVLSGENVLIGGLIVVGKTPKRVIVRALGPSLTAVGVNGALQDPTLELYQGNTLLVKNDNWKDTQQSEIAATGVAPGDNREAAIVRTLAPGNYTAVLRGKNDTTGIALLESYDLDQRPDSKLGNIATRGFVSTGDNVLIGGFIVGPYTRVVVRAIGPSLAAVGIGNPLLDPTLTLVNAQGGIVRANDDWKQTQRAELEAIGIQPSDNRESALVQTLAAGNYTAIVRGKGSATGVAVVEVYNLQ